MAKAKNPEVAKAVQAQLGAIESAIVLLTEAIDLRPRIEAGALNMTVAHRQALTRATQGVAILLLLSQQGDSTVLRLLDNIRLDKSNVSRQVTALASAGLVTITKSPNDRRIKCVSCTPAGRTIANQIVALYSDELERALLAVITPLREAFAGAFAALNAQPTAAAAKGGSSDVLRAP
jgi:DNA-binding MarR family transcriptional regulator